MRLSAGWSRICIASKSRTPSRSITISPSSAEMRRQQLRRAGAAPGSSAAAAARCATRARSSPASFSSSAAEAVPLRLVLPLVARRAARARAPPPSAGTGSTRAGRPAARPVRAEPLRGRAIAASYYALAAMRRVVVTGLGAVTPLGLDAQSTWDAAVAGRSGIDWIRAFDASELPGADRRRGARASTRRPSSGRRRRAGSSATSCSPSRRRSEAWADAGVEGVRPGARRDPRRLGDRRRHRRSWQQNDVLRERGHRPRLAVLPPDRARRHGERADRDRPRHPRAELRARLGVRDRLACDRRGRRDDPARRRRRRPRRRHRVVHAPADPRRLLRDARARRRGGGSDARLAAVRRDARRLRDGRGRVRARARGARGARRRAARRIYAEVLGYGDLERRAPPGAARAGVDRRRRDDARGARRARASSRSGSATSTRTGRRRRSATSPRRGRSRQVFGDARVRARRLVDEVGARATASERPARSRR